jgi:hypothetical protein
MTPKNRYSVPELFRLWAGGASYKEIAASLGVTESYVHKLKDRHKLPNRERKQGLPTADPTPEEIAAGKVALRLKHLAQRRGETDEQTRKRVWTEDNSCRQTSSQSQA